jgi:hypothetical protein
MVCTSYNVTVIKIMKEKLFGIISQQGCIIKNNVSTMKDPDFGEVLIIGNFFKVLRFSCVLQHFYIISNSRLHF